MILEERKVMKVPNLLKICVAIVCCCSGAAWADQDKGGSRRANERPREVRYERESDGDNDRGSYFHRYGYSRLNIPKGHYPPPGECRIWYPDRPAGHQPPPGSCDRLRGQVPAGAWLIRHPDDDAEHVHVVVYDERRPGSILVVGQFKIATGMFVRVVVNR
jgi:hypothetical protein